MQRRPGIGKAPKAVSFKKSIGAMPVAHRALCALTAHKSDEACTCPKRVQACNSLRWFRTVEMVRALSFTEPFPNRLLLRRQ